VDVQEKLLRAMPDARKEDLLRAATILLSAAKELAIPVLATEQYPAGLGPTAPPVLELLRAQGCTPAEKMAFSALSAGPIRAAVEQLAPKHVVVLGMETHVCVYQTARALRAPGREVHVPIDGVASRRDDHREAGLRLAERDGARITTGETLVFDWLERAGTDAFKRLSKLVK